MTRIEAGELGRLREALNNFKPVGAFEEDLKALVMEYVSRDGSSGFTIKELSDHVESKVYDRMRGRPRALVTAALALGAGFAIGYGAGRLVKAMIERF